VSGAMVLSIEVPDAYPIAVLSATVVPFITSILMGGKVMSARKEYKVFYPNLYATPGVHEKADEFNRVQRGHQNMFETLPSVIAMVMFAGLKYPYAAAASSVAYCIGNYVYLLGYADNSKDVKGARYSKPLAVLKPIGMFGSLVACIMACVALR